MHIHVKRIYEKPEEADGKRILVDRLWPRGVSKEEAKIDVWAKEAAPSSELRKWFHEDKAKRAAEFESRYRTELEKNPLALEPFRDAGETFTLVTAAKDVKDSHVPVLTEILKRKNPD